MLLKKLSGLIWGLSFLLVSVPLFGQHQDAGTTGFSTLKNMYSAQGNAMGQAMTGRVMNYDAMQSNPASLLRTPDDAVTSTFMDHFVGSGGGALQYTRSRSIYTAYGFFLNYWNSGAMDRTEISNTGELIDLGDTFGASTIIGGVTLAKFISPAVDLGGNLKFILDQIDDKKASAIVLDGGVIHHTANPKIKIGLTVRNLGLQTSSYSDNGFKEGLPTTFSAGMGYDFNDTNLLNLDIVKATGSNFVAKLGYERVVHPNLVLRAGFRSNAGDYYHGGSLGFTSGLSLGAGWKWKKMTVDYAVASYGDLGIINQLSLRYHFNEIIK